MEELMDAKFDILGPSWFDTVLNVSNGIDPYSANALYASPQFRKIMVYSTKDLLTDPVEMWLLDSIVALMEAMPDRYFIINTQNQYGATKFLGDIPKNAWIGLVQTDKYNANSFWEYDAPLRFISFDPLVKTKSEWLSMFLNHGSEKAQWMVLGIPTKDSWKASNEDLVTCAKFAVDHGIPLFARSYLKPILKEYFRQENPKEYKPVTIQTKKEKGKGFPNVYDAN